MPPDRVAFFYVGADAYIRPRVDVGIDPYIHLPKQKAPWSFHGAFLIII
jgi:hypothetical protein